jgi:uncharacterized membrane protein YccC
VTLTTPYVLLLFHLLYPVEFRSVLSDRVVDTLIGSALSFLANIFIIPSWEHERITDHMVRSITSNAAYFREVAAAFLGKPAEAGPYKLARKNAFVAMANLSDAFGRMLSEPRSKQRPVTTLNEFVVSNHMLTSHIATLSYYETPLAAKYADPAYRQVVDAILARLGNAAVLLQDRMPVEGPVAGKGELRIINDRVNALMERRRMELQESPTAQTATRRQLSEFKPIADQFNFIAKVAGDIEKLSCVLQASPGSLPAAPSL